MGLVWHFSSCWYPNTDICLTRVVNISLRKGFFSRPPHTYWSDCGLVAIMTPWDECTKPYLWKANTLTNICTEGHSSFSTYWITVTCSPWSHIECICAILSSFSNYTPVPCGGNASGLRTLLKKIWLSLIDTFLKSHHHRLQRTRLPEVTPQTAFAGDRHPSAWVWWLKRFNLN